MIGKEIFGFRISSKTGALAGVGWVVFLSGFGVMAISGLLWAILEVFGIDSSWMGWEAEGIIGPLFPRIWSGAFLIGLWIFVFSGLIALGKIAVRYARGDRG